MIKIMTIGNRARKNKIEDLINLELQKNNINVNDVINIQLVGNDIATVVYKA